MNIVETVFYPIIWLMTVLVDVQYEVLGSYGLAIIGVSAIFKVVLRPIVKISRKFEEKERLIQLQMAPALELAKKTKKGREQFEEIDGIYQKHGYHPIKSMVSMLPLFLQIPFLISAFLLFNGYPPLVDQSFLFVSDLSKPDQLLPMPGGVNLNILPIALIGVAVADSFLNPLSDNKSRIRFLLVSLVLFVLVYPLSSAVCLYWLASNIWSIIETMFLRINNASGSENKID